MPKTSMVHLGGREYVLTEKVMGVSRKWREQLRQSSVMHIFQSLDEALNDLVNAVNAMGDEANEGRISFAGGIHLATIAPALVRGLTNSIDDIIALLFDYAPELEADREWIEENAYNEEVIAAFIEVLKLNFPITALWGLIRGPKVQAISTNLPSTNGARGTKKSMGRSKSR
jgi:hypothetical protein